MTNDQYPKAYLYMRIVHAKLFIDNSFSDKIDLDDIITEAFFSKYHFIRTFKNIYGLTPNQYLQKVRIENARQFLKTGLPINEVCFAVGFESVSTFIGLFKKKVGQTPAEYKENHLKRKEQELKNPWTYIPGCFVESMKNSNFEEW